jgi:putative hydrolase of the HAD superfamily
VEAGLSRQRTNGGAQVLAVSFDVGGTLIEPWPSVGQVYADVAAGFTAERLDAREINERFAAAWRPRAGSFDYSRAAWGALVARTFAGSPLATDPVFFRELYEHFALPEAWRIFDDVLPALETLRTLRFKLAVVSNWDDRLRPLLGRLGLSGFFDVIVVSGELGVHKPAPIIFEHAARQLGVLSEAILHVGDSETEDAQGARAAGMKAVQLRRHAPSQPPDQIASLKELTSLLSACSSKPR